MKAPLLFVTLSILAGCAADSSEVEGASEGALTSAVTFDFDASRGEWPKGVTFAFSDYPVSEDVEAESDARKTALARMGDRLVSKLGRPALLTEWARFESPDLHALAGFWLNARFEKLEAGDTAPMVVFSDINRSDDVDTNIVFELDRDGGRLPLTKYTVRASVVLRTHAPMGCSGVGGSPDSVAYGLVFSTSPLRRAVDDIKHHRMSNLPEDAPVESGSALSADKFAGAPIFLGGIGAPHARDCTGDNPFEDVSRDATGTVTTDASGALHGLLHSHSGFEGLSVWGLKSFRVVLTPSAQQGG